MMGAWWAHDSGGHPATPAAKTRKDHPAVEKGEEDSDRLVRVKGEKGPSDALHRLDAEQVKAAPDGAAG
jgi:hypothetical protein